MRRICTLRGKCVVFTAFTTHLPVENLGVTRSDPRHWAPTRTKKGCAHVATAPTYRRLCGRVSRRVLHLLLVTSVHPLHLPQPSLLSSYHQSRHGSRVCSDVAASSGPTPTCGRRDRTRQVRTVTWYPGCRCLRVVLIVSGETIHISSLALLKVRPTTSCTF